MWFLASTPGVSTTRYCTIPTGHSLFLNVSSVIGGAGVFDCDPTAPGVPCDVEKLRALVAEYLPLYGEVMVVRIDGRVVENIRQYHAIAPQPFAVTCPENSLFGAPAGVYYPQVAESYSLIVNPLPRGVHTIAIHAESTTIGFNWDLVYRITID